MSPCHAPCDVRHRHPIAEDLKVQLARAICAALGDCALEDAMYALELDPADVSRLRNGALRPFSVNRLLRLLARLGYDVELRFAPRPRPITIPREPAATVTIVDVFGRPLDS